MCRRTHVYQVYQAELQEEAQCAPRAGDVLVQLCNKACGMAMSNAYQAVRCHALDNSIQHLQQSAAGGALNVG